MNERAPQNKDTNKELMEGIMVPLSQESHTTCAMGNPDARLSAALTDPTDTYLLLETEKRGLVKTTEVERLCS